MLIRLVGSLSLTAKISPMPALLVATKSVCASSVKTALAMAAVCW